MNKSFAAVLLASITTAVLGWIGLVWVVVYTAPNSDWWPQFLLYTLAGVAVAASILSIELPVRKRWFTTDYKTLLRASLRQAILIGVLTDGMLLLQAERLLFWWVAGSLILLFVCIEAFLSL